MDPIEPISERAYWDNYYHTGGAPQFPTQFAAFTMSVADRDYYLVDCGCGSGRDSMFFARAGFSVLGLDASEEAVNLCSTRALKAGLRNIAFKRIDFNDHSACEQMARFVIEQAGEVPVLVYARFLLHALEERGQLALLNFAKELCGRSGLLAVEFRTHRDRHQEKATAAHYRRYINPADFSNDAFRVGFKLEYQVEGFGFAKYKNDDAHVYRGLFLVESR